MSGSLRFAVLFCVCLVMAFALISPSDCSTSEVQSVITIPSETPVTLRGNQTTNLDIDGFFIVTDMGPLDSVGGLTATLEITGGGWGPTLSRTIWTEVKTQTDYSFMVTLTIGADAKTGESNSYLLTLTFSNPISNDLGSSTASLLVRIEGLIDNDDDDGNTADDDETTLVEDGSLPLWPFFVGAILVGLIIVAIWAWKNLEVVRDNDGSRRIYLREKDSGHVLGKKKQPPPELDL